MFTGIDPRGGFIERWRARAARRARYRALAELSDQTLRDLAIGRSELSSVVAELEGRVELTRTRLLRERQP